MMEMNEYGKEACKFAERVLDTDREWREKHPKYISRILVGNGVAIGWGITHFTVRVNDTNMNLLPSSDDVSKARAFIEALHHKLDEEEYEYNGTLDTCGEEIIFIYYKKP